MKSVGRWVSRHRIWVILVCAALMVPSVLGMAATRIEYDLLYYLPQDLETVRGQNILLEDFDMGAFSLLVTEGMPEADQASMEETIAEIPHVKSVLGWASVVKGALPAEIIPPEYRDLIQNGDARLTAVFFDTGTSAEETMDAIEDTMQSNIGDLYAGGDIVRGGATVILAMGDGRRAAQNMAKQLLG